MAAIARHIFVISDLHLGGVYGTQGKRGFRLNTHVDQLAQFVEGLLRQASNGAKLELIINGDMVDFLAEREAKPPDWIPFTPDPEAASEKMAAIAGRDAAFFGALKDFLRRGHRLTILMGNHDIELGLPQVRARLEQLLGVDGRQDYRLIYNGEAYIVGDALIEHGNRYDMWNVVDYDSLRRVSSLHSRRQPVPEKYALDPPAGSKMVAWVMNPVKEHYGFIDLLKPETGAAIPTLLALEPGYRKNLATVARLALQARRHGLEEAALPSFGGDIHADAGAVAEFGSDISSMEPEDPERHLRQVLEGVLKEEAQSFLGHIEKSSAPRPPGEQIGEDISTIGEIVEQASGLFHLLLGKKSDALEQRLPALWKAFRALQNDQSFDPGVETAPEYLEAARSLAKGGFRYVLFGHTHLRKKIKLDGDAYYLNSGTWVDLIQVPKEILTGTEQQAMPKLREFMNAVAKGDLAPWILYQPTYLRLDLGSDGKISHADFYDYRGDAAYFEQRAG